MPRDGSGNLIDPYGDTLPQVIAETIMPPSPSGVIRSLTDVVTAVQPGNENNIDNASYTPLLRGSTQYDRGVSHGQLVREVHAALQSAGAPSVEVWSTGTVGDPYDFFRGVMSESSTRSVIGGLSVHCYGKPPVNQLSLFGSRAKAVRDLYGTYTPIYSTETEASLLTTATKRSALKTYRMP